MAGGSAWSFVFLLAVQRGLGGHCGIVGLLVREVVDVCGRFSKTQALTLGSMCRDFVLGSKRGSLFVDVADLEV
jgi:hypothetical protein